MQVYRVIYLDDSYHSGCHEECDLSHRYDETFTSFNAAKKFALTKFGWGTETIKITRETIDVLWEAEGDRFNSHQRFHDEIEKLEESEK